jgi:hypothetical protein
MMTAMMKTAIWLCVLALALALVSPYTFHSKLQHRSPTGYRGSKGAAASSKLYTGGVSGESDNFSPSDPVVPIFPYGMSGFRTIMSDKSFCIDKTSYIRTLEMSGKYIKIWRPKRFGKTLVCDMLAEYYDASNSADQVILLSVEHSNPSIL